MNCVTGSPTEFRLGRRASDGLVGGRKLAFSNKLEGARAGGVAALAGQIEGPCEELEGAVGGLGCGMLGEELVGESPIPEHPLNLLCSPAKRPSLPDSWKLLPDNTWTSRDVWADFPAIGNFSREGGGGAGSTGSGASSSSTSAQLHRQLMALRLQRRTGVMDPPGMETSWIVFLSLLLSLDAIRSGFGSPPVPWFT